MAGRLNSSPVWMYFKAIDSEEAKCKLCSQKVRRGGGTTNLRNHLRINHFTEYFELKNTSNLPVDEPQNGDVNDLELENDCTASNASSQSSVLPLPSPTLSTTVATSALSSSPRCSSTTPASPASGARVSVTGVERGKNQDTLDKFKVPDKKSNEKLHMAVAYYICTSNKPLKTVEDEGFRVMLQCFRPSYVPCGRKALTNTYMPKLYQGTKDLILRAVRAADHICFTTDAWTSNVGEPFMALTAHFIDSDWKLVSLTLCCRVLNIDHTGINIKEWLIETLHEWYIPLSKVTCFTTDNGDNIRCAIDLLTVPHVRCLGHTLQNGVEVIDKLPDITALRKSTHALQMLFSSPKISNKYKVFIEQRYNITPRRLPGLCPTRWWSELPLNQVLIEDENYHREFLATYDKGSKLHLMLSSCQMELLKTYTGTLQPLEELTSAMSSDSYVTASALLPVVHLIDKVQDEAETREQVAEPDHAQQEENGRDFEVETAENEKINHPDLDMLRPILEKLHKRYRPHSAVALTLQMRRCDVQGAEKCHNLLVKCSFLDPRFINDLPFEEITSAKTQLRAEFLDDLPLASRSDLPESLPPPIKKSKGGLASVFEKLSGRDGGCSRNRGEVATETLIDDFDKELTRFENQPTVSMDDDVLAWWKNHASIFPLLKRYAKKYLSVMATSTPAERVFSAGGRVITDQRTCLTGERADQLIFLSMNKKIVTKPK